MKAFIDTSTLFKRYVSAEKGSETLAARLRDIDEIVVAPTYIVEMHSILARLRHEERITAQQAAALAGEVTRDYTYFLKVMWSDDLEEIGVMMVRKYRIKTLDAIQLAAARLARADVVMTSDKRLFAAVKDEFTAAEFI